MDSTFSGGAPLPPIRFRELAEALLARAETLVPAWLPGGRREGHEYKCGSLRGGDGRSCSVNLNSGAWADFATGEQGGDLLSLYAAIDGLSPARAALAVAADEGLEDVAGIVRGAHGAGAQQHQRPVRAAPPPAAPKAPTPSENWASVVPVPAHAPKPTFWHHARKPEDLVHLAEYRHGPDALMGYVVRFRTSDGGKDTLPYTWAQSARDGACKWHWKTWDEPRPLYFPAHTLPAGRTVVLVEGEKKGDTLQRVLDELAPGVYAVASWPGGCKAWKKADWAPLAGCTVVLWPDCDAKREKLTPTERKACADEAELQALQASKPLLAAHAQLGMAAMLGIGALLRDAQGCTVQLLPIPEPGTVADGWDCGDAIDADGWDAARVGAFLAQAYALPLTTPENGATGPDGVAAGQKIDGPVDTANGGDGGVPPAGGAGDDAGDDARMPWWLRPYWDSDKARWLVSRKLVIAALEHDPKLAGLLGMNLLSNTIEARGAWPWEHGKAGPITGSVDLMLGQYLSRRYGLPSINRAALMEAIETVAHGRPFHPVREYLQGLQHDGGGRIDKWLLYALGETPQSLPAVVVEYLCLVGRFILLGMVYRVMEPGCKFDYCPVLEGPAGLRKSTLVETLAGQWFSDTHFDPARGKEGQEQVQGLWVYELAELSAFGKAEVNLIKAFISAKVDRYRPSYGRVVEAYPRQCVLFGTTNQGTYLRDRTGNRRFWPVPVRHTIRTDWVAKFRDQLFAEAFALYTQRVAYTPDSSQERRLFNPMQDSRLVETAVLSELQAVLTRDPQAAGIAARVNNLTEFVTMGELVLALGVDAAKSNAALEGQIRDWMANQGWERVKRQVNGVRAWGYARPRDWPPVDDAPNPFAEPTPAARPALDQSSTTAPGSDPGAINNAAEDAPF